MSDHWTFEYDLAFNGLAEEVFIAVALAEQDEAISAGRKNPVNIDAAALSGFQTLEVRSGGDREHLCSAIYSRFVTGTASKAVAAQYLADILNTRIKPGGTPEAPRSRGCRRLLRVRRHDRDGSRVSSRRPNSPVPFGRVGHRDAIEETWGRPKVDEAFAAGEPRISGRESDNDLLSQPGTTAPRFRKEA